jgi:hypothetical protein
VLENTKAAVLVRCVKMAASDWATKQEAGRRSATRGSAQRVNGLTVNRLQKPCRSKSRSFRSTDLSGLSYKQFCWKNIDCVNSFPTGVSRALHRCTPAAHCRRRYRTRTAAAACTAAAPRAYRRACRRTRRRCTPAAHPRPCAAARRRCRRRRRRRRRRRCCCAFRSSSVSFQPPPVGPVSRPNLHERGPLLRICRHAWASRHA